MTVKPPPPYSQVPLFDLLPDKRLTTPGESRTRYGRVVEEIVCELLRLTDIRNSGSHECVFDAHGYGTYVEVKSVRAGSKIPIYEWRREKDAASGVPLCYVIAIHRCGGVNTLADVWRKMAKTMKEILVIPADMVSAAAAIEGLRMLTDEVPGSRMGYKRTGYCKGYRNLSLSSLRALSYHLAVKRECGIYGLFVAADVRFHETLTPWF